VFNVCVDAVIREWLRRTLSKEAARGELNETSRKSVAFYVDNGLVGSRDPIWLQSALNILVTLRKYARAEGVTLPPSEELCPSGGSNSPTAGARNLT
jgi:hypothetical protein